MPNLMMNYSFGGGGVLLIISSISFLKSLISKVRVRINSELCSMRFMIISDRESQSLLFFPHSSFLVCSFLAWLERGRSQTEGKFPLGTFWYFCSCIRVWKGFLVRGGGDLERRQDAGVSL